MISPWDKLSRTTNGGSLRLGRNDLKMATIRVVAMVASPKKKLKNRATFREFICPFSPVGVVRKAREIQLTAKKVVNMAK